MKRELILWIFNYLLIGTVAMLSGVWQYAIADLSSGTGRNLHESQASAASFGLLGVVRKQFYEHFTVRCLYSGSTRGWHKRYIVPGPSR